MDKDFGLFGDGLEGYCHFLQAFKACFPEEAHNIPDIGDKETEEENEEADEEFLDDDDNEDDEDDEDDDEEEDDSDE